MNDKIENLKKTRLYLLEQAKHLSTEQLNEVPPGFNNNIVWNLGHMIAAQQGICYLRAGLKTVVDEKYFLLYKPGTRPEQFVNQEEVEMIKGLMLSSLTQLQEDYQNNIFERYTSWSTRYGVELQKIEDAINFLMYHEGLHSGVITALIKLVKK